MLGSLLIGSGVLVITQRCLKFFLFFLFVALFVGVVSAKVYPPSNSHLHLGYCNGTYTDAPSGYLYYDSLQRINNVWYINGQAVSTPSTESFDTTIGIALIAFVFAVAGLSFAISRKRRANSSA